MPPDPRLYSTRNDSALITVWLNSEIESRAWIKSAFTVDNGFPVIKIVNVSSFSDAIKLPNHDFFVNSGEDSGVGLYGVSMSI